MKIAVFGGTGRTGIPFIEQALAAGHNVTALVRTPSKMPIQNERLTLIQGDVKDTAAVDKTVAGADAVVSLLGPSKGDKDTLATAGRNIVAAMKKHGVKRLVAMTGAGVRAPQDQPKFFDNVMGFLLKATAGDVLRDSEAYANAIRNSGLDWTLARVPMLTDGAPTGKYRVGWAGVNTGPRLARADGATFMLKQLDDREYVGKAPVVSN